MSILGSNWKDENTPEEDYKSITGEDFHGTKEELEKRISRKLGDSYTSKLERSKLLDFQEKISNGESRT